MRSISFVLLGLFLSSSAMAAKFQTAWLSGPVVDEVGLLSPSQKSAIEQDITSFKSRGLGQIQVYVVKSLQGLEIEQASIEISDQWKLGDAKKDNGILFLVAPNEKKLRIEVGQGLEGVLPDITAKRIISDVVIPHFREGNMGLGVQKGVSVIMAVVAGDEVPAEQKSASSGRLKTKGSWLIIILWILFFVFTRFGGGGRGSGRSALLGGALGYGLGRGGFGGSGGGGGWSGGGGGFSGGGASGSW